MDQVVLRDDPSLMFFGIIRAINHESLFSLAHVTRLMDNAYRNGNSGPGFCEQLAGMVLNHPQLTSRHRLRATQQAIHS